MGKYLKIESIGLWKLNNAEYANLMNRTQAYVLVATAEKLGASETLMDTFISKLNLLNDIVAHSKASVETAKIQDIDKKARSLIVHLMKAFRTHRTSPMQNISTAAEILYLKTKPYVGCQKLPRGQVVQMIRGLIYDLSPEDMMAHLATLGLTAVLEELATTLAQYISLIDQRAASQIENKLEAGKTVRKEMDELYDDLTTIAFVTSVATPSPEATAFVVNMNKLIADTNAAFKQRTAPHKDDSTPSTADTPEELV